MTSRKHDVPEELLSQLLANYQNPEDLIGENGLLKELTKRLVERALDTEMTEHLGHDKHQSVGNAKGNTRNGRSRKTLKGEFGELPIEVPRDRDGSFEPKLVPKHQTRWNGFDDKILSLYARAMTVREIQAHLEEMYGAEVSPSLISSITDAVTDEVKAWRGRPLDTVYPIVYMDCLHVKVREGAVRVKAVYLAIGITLNGEKEVLGLWLAQTEGAKFWLQVVTELRNRGVQDIFIACVDGLKGFPEAIETVFPKTTVQLCIVHMVRQALLRKSALGLTISFPVPFQATASISALPRAEKRFMMAMRIWISAVWRSGSRDMIRSPKSFRQFICASTRLRTW